MTSSQVVLPFILSNHLWYVSASLKTSHLFFCKFDKSTSANRKIIRLDTNTRSNLIFHNFILMDWELIRFVFSVFNFRDWTNLIIYFIVVCLFGFWYLRLFLALRKLAYVTMWYVQSISELVDFIMCREHSQFSGHWSVGEVGLTPLSTLCQLFLHRVNLMLVESRKWCVS